METLEKWKDIKGFGGRYSISSYGRCIENFYVSKGILGTKRGKKCEDKVFRGVYKKNVTKEKKALARRRSNGYYFQLGNIEIGQKRVKKSVALLVAEHFLLNPLNRERITWADGNPSNNRVDNLKWLQQAVPALLTRFPDCYALRRSSVLILTLFDKMILHHLTYPAR